MKITIDSGKGGTRKTLIAKEPLPDKSRVEKCLDHTMNTCPVGVLYRQAGVKITSEIQLLETLATETHNIN